MIILYDLAPYLGEARFARYDQHGAPLTDLCSANTSPFSALLALATDTARFATIHRQTQFADATIQPTQVAVLDVQLFTKQLPVLPRIAPRRPATTSSPGRSSSPARNDNRPGSELRLDLASVCEWFVDVIGRFDVEPAAESMADADDGEGDSIQRLTALTWWRSARKALPDGGSDEPHTVRLEVKHGEKDAVPFAWRASTSVQALV